MSINTGIRINMPYKLGIPRNANQGIALLTVLSAASSVCVADNNVLEEHVAPIAIFFMLGLGGCLAAKVMGFCDSESGNRYPQNRLAPQPTCNRNRLPVYSLNDPEGPPSYDDVVGNQARQQVHPFYNDEIEENRDQPEGSPPRYDEGNQDRENVPRARIDNWLEPSPSNGNEDDFRQRVMDLWNFYQHILTRRPIEESVV